MKRLFLLSIVLISLMSITVVAQSPNIEFDNLTKFYTFDGNYQKGMVGKELPKKLKVKATYHWGNPNSGVSVDFRVTHGSGTVRTHDTFLTSLTSTDSQGIASATVTAGNTTGWLTVEAYSVDLHNIEKKVAYFEFQILEPVTRKLVTNGTGESNVWKKFKGKTVPAGVPDIIDWSYAGYKNGEEGIPDTFNLPYYNVTDYGAIPNDNRSDTAAIQRAVDAANSGNSILFFPPGQYDVFYDNEENTSFKLEADNIIVRGSGAAGAKQGGTTIKCHNSDSKDIRVFATSTRTRGSYNGFGGGSDVVGSFPKGSTYFDVENAHTFSRQRFIEINRENITGAEWDRYSSRPRNDMLRDWDIRDGIKIVELNEIDRIEGNRVYVKSPIITHLNSNFNIRGGRLIIGVGFEDLHIDCGWTDQFSHPGGGLEDGFQAFMIHYAAHSWIRRCRISNATTGFKMSDSYACSAISIIVDGNSGHHVGTTYKSTRCFSGLIEDISENISDKNGAWHGLEVASQSVGNVMWAIGGIGKGPDTHGNQPRETLYDNYFSSNHQSSGGALTKLPFHLDGYMRWNNIVDSSSTFNVWNPGGWNFSVTQASIIGYKTTGGSQPKNAYVESFGTHVAPDSLYVAQLNRRLGYTPAWIDEVKEDYENFFGQIFGRDLPDIEGPRNILPVFSDTSTTTLEVDENTASNVNIGSPFTATDADTRDTLTYRLEGSDASSFTIDSSTGQIKTSGPLNHELRDIYIVNVKVFDGVAEITLAITINVLDVNEAPKFIRPFGATSLYLYVDETTITGKLVGNPITATDVDADDTLTYSLLSVDSDPFYADHYESFEIDSETGQLKTRVAMIYISRDDSFYLIRTYAIILDIGSSIG